MRQPRLADRFFNERFCYGGIEMTRAEIIEDMRRAGHPERCIDRWFQGAEHAQQHNHHTKQ